MITGLGIGVMGFGLILVYAGVTGQHLTAELQAVFTGKTPATAPLGLNQQAAAGLLPPPTPLPVSANPLPTSLRPAVTDTGNILGSVKP